MRKDDQMSVTPPKSGPPVAAVIIIGSALLLVVAVVIVALSIGLTQGPSRPARDDAEDDEPEVTEIVLDARWGDGSALQDDDFDTVEEIVTGRLDDVGITGFELSLDDDQVHVIFDDDTEEDTLDAAAEVLDITFRADFRPVLEVILCAAGSDYTDLGPDEEVTLCDQQGAAAFVLGPSEVSGETIIGSSTYQRDDGTWGVTIVFDPVGSADLGTLTARLAENEGNTNRVGITLGGQVIESPSVSEAIMNGEVSIGGSFDEEGATALAAQLRFAAKQLELSVDSTSFAK